MGGVNWNIKLSQVLRNYTSATKSPNIWTAMITFQDTTDPAANVGGSDREALRGGNKT